MGDVVSHVEVATSAARARSARQRAKRAVLVDYAEAEGLPCHSLPANFAKQTEWQVPQPEGGGAFDIGVVASFGHFVPRYVIESLPQGALNMHPSMLPRYRGANPIQHALLNGDDRTGVSIIELHPQRFDAGALVHSEEAPILPDDTYETLRERLAEQGAAAVLRVLRDLEAYRLREIEQDDDLATSAPKLGRQFVDWSAWSATDVYNAWRAVGGTAGVFSAWEARGRAATAPLRLVKVAPYGVNMSIADSGRPGDLHIDKRGGRLLARARDAWVELVEVQKAGKPAVTGANFAAGHAVAKGGARLLASS